MTEKSCDTCLHRCMDMDLDPYCYHPELGKTNRFGLILSRNRVEVCNGSEGEKPYLLWEKDTRRDP